MADSNLLGYYISLSNIGGGGERQEKGKRAWMRRTKSKSTNVVFKPAPYQPTQQICCPQQSAQATWENVSNRTQKKQAALCLDTANPI